MRRFYFALLVAIPLLFAAVCTALVMVIAFLFAPVAAHLCNGVDLAELGGKVPRINLEIVESGEQLEAGPRTMGLSDCDCTIESHDRGTGSCFEGGVMAGDHGPVRLSCGGCPGVLGCDESWMVVQ